MIQVYKGIKQGSKDLSGFARDEALGVLRGIIIPFTIIGLLVVVLFFLLGYSSFWFGPSGFFKVMSVIGLIAFLGFVLVSQMVLFFAKRLLHKAKHHVDKDFFSHDVTPR